MSSSRKILHPLQPKATKERVGENVLRSTEQIKKCDSYTGGKSNKSTNQENECIREPASETIALGKIMKSAEKNVCNVDQENVDYAGISNKNNSTNFSVPPNRILQWMTQQEPSEGYWRELAEQRRVALEEALKENELLERKNIVLTEENNSLREINEVLQEMAIQGERLADLLQDLDSNRNEH